MRMMLSAAAALLAGCISAEQAQVNQIMNSPEYQAALQQQRNQEYRDGLMAQCSRIGFQAGTEAFSNCVLQLHTTQQQQNTATRNVILQQAIEQQRQQDYRALPACPVGLAPFLRSRAISEGRCR